MNLIHTLHTYHFNPPFLEVPSSNHPLVRSRPMDLRNAFLVPELVRAGRLASHGNMGYNEYCGHIWSSDVRGLVWGRARDYPHAHLSLEKWCRRDLSRSNLRGLKFKQCDLTDANLSYANLRDTTFESNLLQGCDFSHSDMRGATIKGSVFHTKFNGADLRGADLSRVTCILVGNPFKGAIMDSSTKVRKAWA